MQGDSLHTDSEGLAEGIGMEDVEMDTMDEESAPSEDDDMTVSLFPHMITISGGLNLTCRETARVRIRRAVRRVKEWNRLNWGLWMKNLRRVRMAWMSVYFSRDLVSFNLNFYLQGDSLHTDSEGLAEGVGMEDAGMGTLYEGSTSSDKGTTVSLFLFIHVSFLAA